ncbi:MAG: type II secretion system F family protein [Acidimicrobiales bacterium]
MTAPLLGLAVAGLVLLGAGAQPPRRPGRGGGSTPARPLTARGGALLDRLVPGRRERQRDRQLPDALDRLGSALRAGDAVGPGVVALARDLPDPLGGELRRVGRAVEHGQPIADALAAWSGSERGSRDVRLVAAALTLGAGAGGEVARAVDGVAATLRERHEVAAEAHALATQARASAALLVAAPLAFTAVVATVEPRAVGFLLTTPVGLACLVLGSALDVGGAAWMARITRGAG